MTRLVNLEHREERFLRDLHGAHLLHPLLSFLLLFEQLALPRDVAAVALGGHVLAQRPDRPARDHLGPDRRLDHDLEQLPRDQLLQLFGELLAPLVRLVAVDDDGEGVHRVTVEEQVELHQVRRPVFEKLVIERGVAARDGLQLVVEVEDDLGQRKLPAEVHARRVHVVHRLVDPAALLAELHDRPDVFGRRHDPRLDVGPSTWSTVEPCGMRLGFSTSSTAPSVLWTWYSTFGTVLIRSRLNSRSSRSRTISMWSRPRNPQRKPKPRATDDSGS